MSPKIIPCISRATRESLGRGGLGAAAPSSSIRPVHLLVGPVVSEGSYILLVTLGDVTRASRPDLQAAEEPVGVGEVTDDQSPR